MLMVLDVMPSDMAYTPLLGTLWFTNENMTVNCISVHSILLNIAIIINEFKIVFRNYISKIQLKAPTIELFDCGVTDPF